MAWTGQPLAYVTSSDGISVIDTGDNKVVDTIRASALPTAVAPDGKHLYAFGSASDLVANISVIDATDDTGVATVPLDVSLVGGVSLDQNSSAIAITPDGRHAYVPYFDNTPSENVAIIDLDRRPNLDAFDLESTFISTASHEIHPGTESVKLQVGPYIATIPAGSFRRQEDGTYIFEGVIVARS